MSMTSEVQEMRDQQSFQAESRQAVAWLQTQAGIVLGGRDAFLAQRGKRAISLRLPERRDNGAHLDTTGGYTSGDRNTVAVGIVEAMDNLSPVRRLSRIHQTPIGVEAKVPLVDERAIEGQIIDENQ